MRARVRTSLVGSTRGGLDDDEDDEDEEEEEEVEDIY